MTLIVSMIILYIYRFSSSIESIECIHCFMTIQFFSFFFLELFKIYRTKGKRRYELVTSTRYSETRSSKFYQFRGSWFREILRYRLTISFFFFLLLSFFISPPFPLFTSRRPRERPRRDLKVSITVYNNYRCFKKIWLLSLFRPVYCALHFFFYVSIVFKHRCCPSPPCQKSEIPGFWKSKDIPQFFEQSWIVRFESLRTHEIKQMSLLERWSMEEIPPIF